MWHSRIRSAETAYCTGIRQRTASMLHYSCRKDIAMGKSEPSLRMFDVGGVLGATTTPGPATGRHRQQSTELADAVWERQAGRTGSARSFTRSSAACARAAAERASCSATSFADPVLCLACRTRPALALRHSRASRSAAKVSTIMHTACKHVHACLAWAWPGCAWPRPGKACMNMFACGVHDGGRLACLSAHNAWRPSQCSSAGTADWAQLTSRCSLWPIL